MTCAHFALPLDVLLTKKLRRGGAFYIQYKNVIYEIPRGLLKTWFKSLKPKNLKTKVKIAYEAAKMTKPMIAAVILFRAFSV
jgi:hypothetical protein